MGCSASVTKSKYATQVEEPQAEENDNDNKVTFNDEVEEIAPAKPYDDGALNRRASTESDAPWLTDEEEEDMDAEDGESPDQMADAGGWGNMFGTGVQETGQSFIQ